jgi:hypothetical protein
MNRDKNAIHFHKFFVDPFITNFSDINQVHLDIKHLGRPDLSVVSH